MCIRDSYESGAVIANDSGNGHLASFLGVPVVTIYRKRNPKFHWRPDWASATVVCPRLTLPGFRGDIWKPFVGVSDVIAAQMCIRDSCLPDRRAERSGSAGVGFGRGDFSRFQQQGG